MTLTIEERLKLIKRNTSEILTEEELINVLKTKEHPSIYMGTATTGRPHIGYLAWAQILADFSKAGFKVKVLIADIHGALDNTPWELLDKRYEYYNIVIPAMVESVGGIKGNVEVIKGSSYQLNKDFVMDLYKMSSYVSVRNSTKAASDVVKMGDNPMLSGLLYPLLQALDEQYLDVDAQLGGVDQRKIMVLAREFLPKLGYHSRVEVMLPLMRGLTQDGKMSSSVQNSKIDLLDDLKTIQDKLKSAYCPEGDLENGIMDFAKTIIMTQKQDKNEEFIIDRPEKWGGPLKFKTVEELEKAFVSKQLHPMDLKSGVAIEIDKLLIPIRNKMIGKEDLIKEAYPQ
ncbi:MAG: tyrosine--tRNA ligase [archaeon]|jgi:tyrosyl-tRNA synthetase